MQALEHYLECHRKLCSMLGYEPTLQSFLDGNSNIANNNDPDYRRSHDKNGRHYKEGEFVMPGPGEQFSPYAYSSDPSHLKHCSEKHDLTEQQIEEMKTKWSNVTDEDIEEIKARWWCYDSNGNTKNNTTIST